MIENIYEQSPLKYWSRIELTIPVSAIKLITIYTAGPIHFGGPIIFNGP